MKNASKATCEALKKKSSTGYTPSPATVRSATTTICRSANVDDELPNDERRSCLVVGRCRLAAGRRLSPHHHWNWRKGACSDRTHTATCLCTMMAPVADARHLHHNHSRRREIHVSMVNGQDRAPLWSNTTGVANKSQPGAFD